MFPRCEQDVHGVWHHSRLARTVRRCSKDGMLTPAQNKIVGWRRDPVQFVRDSFCTEPDEWQKDVLAQLAGTGRKRVAMKSRARPREDRCTRLGGMVQAGMLRASRGASQRRGGIDQQRQSRDNLWAELAKWQARSKYLQATFTWTKQRIFANDHPETWFLPPGDGARTPTVTRWAAHSQGFTLNIPFISWTNQAICLPT